MRYRRRATVVYDGRGLDPEHGLSLGDQGFIDVSSHGGDSRRRPYP